LMITGLAAKPPGNSIFCAASMFMPEPSLRR
jgi:hypothetical protein